MQGYFIKEEVMSKVKFKEQQTFRELSILGLLAFLIIGLSIGLVNQSAGNTSSNSLLELAPIALSFLVLCGAFAYYWNVKYTVKVNEKGISYQYFPQHQNTQKIKWEEIENVEIISTSAATQLSGWNVQFANENMYSLSGRNGLDVQLKNGDRIFLGAKNLDKLQKVIMKLDALAA